jgi:predicted ATPase
VRIRKVQVTGFRSIDDSGELPLGPITVVVGRNNTGKSSLLRAIYQLQEGAPWSETDVRIGADHMALTLEFEDHLLTLTGGENRLFGRSDLSLSRRPFGAPEVSVKAQKDGQGLRIGLFPLSEPRNLIYPSLSGRRWTQQDEQVRKDATTGISSVDNNLVSRFSTVSDPRTEHGREFAELCSRVLGLNLNLLTAENGQRIGLVVDRYTDIGLHSMGTGILTVLSLLLNMTGASGKLFLIEEPENDLHPAALKALLDVVVEKSYSNQFIITTHSSIVLTRLGMTPEAIVLECSSDSQLPPKSTFSVVEGREQRVAVLRDLGYELADLDLAYGWLIFEESSAERLCKDYLIPWFAPGLRVLNTVAAAGTSRVPALTQNLFEMLIFAHLEPAYRYRAWVIVDGDAAGQEALDVLKSKFANSEWPADRFLHWNQPDLESYFPEQFQNEVNECRTLSGKPKRDAKRDLLRRVLDWIEQDLDRARQAFESSAAGAIQTLQHIEKEFGAKPGIAAVDQII